MGNQTQNMVEQIQKDVEHLRIHVELQEQDAQGDAGDSSTRALASEDGASTYYQLPLRRYLLETESLLEPDNQRLPLTNTDFDEPLSPAISPTHSQQPPQTTADSDISSRPAISIMTIEGALTHYFSPPRTKYTNENFDDIARLLYSSGLSRYSTSPRLYTLLRHLGCLHDLDRLLEDPNGLSDSSLPLSQTQLQADFSEGWKFRFRDAQSLVCDSSGIERMIRMRKHMTFDKMPNFFLQTKSFGTGPRGGVDEVYCTLGDGLHCARKRFHRPAMSIADAASAAAFLNEVECMKRIAHRHCVELVRL
jgi:hypothetical protein